MDDDDDNEVSISTTIVLNPGPKTRRDEYLRKVGKALSRHLWYHGLMPRGTVEEVLQKDGDFLVRKTDKDVIHCKNRQWTIRHLTKPSLTELIVAHFNEKIPVKGDGTILKVGISRSDFHIMHEDVDLGERLGIGAYGEVCSGILRRDEDEIKVAVKTLKREVGKQERVELVNEAKTICQFDHQNIVKVFGIAPLEEPMLMVMEFVPGGNLSSRLSKHPEIPTGALERYTLDAARGMTYLSTRGIVHRDIAARNCLLGSNDEVKIADFGMSIVVQDECKLERMGRVPVRWLAPESLRSRKFSIKTDIWSFGVLIWEIFSRRQNRPYYEFSNSEAKKHVLSGNTLQPPEECPDYIAIIMNNCFSQDPEDRPDFVAILKSMAPCETPPTPSPDAIKRPILPAQLPALSKSKKPYEKRRTTTSLCTNNNVNTTSQPSSSSNTSTETAVCNGSLLSPCNGELPQKEQRAKSLNRIDNIIVTKNETSSADRRSRKENMTSSENSPDLKNRPTPVIIRKKSFKEIVLMRFSRKSRRRNDPKITLSHNNSLEENEREAEKEMKIAVECVSKSATNTPTPARKCLNTLKKVKSLSPCKSPRTLEIPNIFKKNETPSKFCFTNIISN